MAVKKSRIHDRLEYRDIVHPVILRRVTAVMSAVYADSSLM